MVAKLILVMKPENDSSYCMSLKLHVHQQLRCVHTIFENMGRDNYLALLSFLCCQVNMMQVFICETILQGSYNYSPFRSFPSQEMK